ncbi:MAG: SDR family NAD(P)-dependent oxidoreductase [Clostridiales bacterium]|nr:SDR family NAD(P)-dependent oxidoreductase [Clostridiales bacterium]
MAYRKIRRKRWRTTDARMDGKLCVITGATSGVGLAAARRLAKGGADLVLVARDRDKAEAVKAELEAAHAVRADIVIADFVRLSDVRGAAEDIRSRYPAVDVLINCAGLFSTKRRVTEDGHEMTFQVNHLASFLMTMLLLETVIRSPQGRIIQVNSFGHRFGGLDLGDLDWQRRAYLWPRAYGASKLAQLMAMHTFAALLKETDATVNAVHPGLVGSNIVQNSGFLLRWLMHTFKKRLLKDPAVSGEALYFLAAAPELKHMTGRYFSLTAEAKPAAVTKNEALCVQVWERSLGLTGLRQSP